MFINERGESSAATLTVTDLNHFLFLFLLSRFKNFAAGAKPADDHWLGFRQWLFAFRSAECRFCDEA